MARCPECNAKLTMPAEYELWDHITCEACEADLEIVDLNPLMLEPVYDFEEDADDLDDLEEDADDLDWEDEEEEEEENAEDW